MQVEGVLRKPVTGAVMDAGRRLYHGLASTYRIVLVTEESDQARISGWLGMEGFSKHDHIVYPMTWPQDTRLPTWVSTARVLGNSYGYDTDLFVITDPHDARMLIRHGYNTLLFTQAAYALPEWRPDHGRGVQSWDDLMTEITAQRKLRAVDKRTEGGDIR